jgi:MFS family permease
MKSPLKFPYRYRVVILLYFLVLVTYLDRTTISLVGLQIKAALHLSNTQFGWVLGAFALAYALFEIPSALLGELFLLHPPLDGVRLFLSMRLSGYFGY